MCGCLLIKDHFTKISGKILDFRAKEETIVFKNNKNQCVSTRYNILPVKYGALGHALRMGAWATGGYYVYVHP